MKERLRVAILFGGRSGEHEVSLASAASIVANLDPERYEVLPIGITKEGRWVVGADPARALQAGLDSAELTPVALLPDPTQRALLTLDGASGSLSSALGRVDVVFPVLHGTNGEDGTVQGLLELANVPYVGAGVLGSAVGMDKVTMKDLFVRHGLPVVEHLAVRRRHWETHPRSVVEQVEDVVGYPCFVKPANLGSSVGVTKVRSREELVAAMNLAAEYDRKLLVERAVDAREVECGVLGNEEPVASVVGEVVPRREFYDYQAKYLDEETQLIIPAQIPEATAEAIRAMAIRAFKAVGCEGLARVDFFLTRDTGQVYVNELNTMPGFTTMSMYPRMWAATGLSFSALLDRLIELAIERYQDKQRCRTTYDVPSA
ncbi:MAG TPA: D-alanine--D-alanine ligase [Chloroflexota bacterium]